MAKYLRLFKNHEEYEDVSQSGETIYKAHCIENVHLHNDNTYYPGSQDGYPEEDPEDDGLDGGYYYP